MDKIEQLKLKLEEFQSKSAAKEEIKAFTKLVLYILKNHKDSFDKLSEDNLNTVKKSIAYLERSYKGDLNAFYNEKESLINEFNSQISTVKDLISKVKTIKPTDGKDGKDGKNPDPKDVAKLVLDAIPTPKEITAEDIANKLETLEGEDKLDFSALKNVPDFTSEKTGGVVARNIYQMGDVSLTSLANNDVLKWDNTNKLWVNGVGSGGTIDGSGTTNELTYWVDTDTVGSLATATYPSLTELSYVKGVTSAIQTQLNGKQASDTQLTDLAGLSYAGNALKYIRVNAGENGFELSTVSSGSGITRTIVSTSGSATMGSTASTDYVYFVTGLHTMSLPSPNTNRYTVKNNHSANITIDTAGAELIEGAASISIAPGESVDIISDTTNWFVL